MKIDIPKNLKSRLELDRKLGAVAALTLSRFEEWIAHSHVPFFTDYTDHGPDHIKEVLETSEQLISEAAWKVVSAQDVGVLILATLLHDCAMHLQPDGFIALVRNMQGTQSSTSSRARTATGPPGRARAGPNTRLSRSSQRAYRHNLKS